MSVSTTEWKSSSCQIFLHFIQKPVQPTFISVLLGGGGGGEWGLLAFYQTNPVGSAVLFQNPSYLQVKYAVAVDLFQG